MSDFLESVRRVHAEMHPDKVLFYEEENGAVDNGGMSHHDVGRRLEAWAGQREGSPHAYLQSGTVREHLAASPMAWCTAVLFVLALAVLAVAGMTDRGAALLEGSPMVAKAAANGYLYGFLLACASVALMCARKVEVLTFGDDARQAVRVGYGVRVAMLDVRKQAVDAAGPADDALRASFFWRNGIFRQGSFAQLGGRLVPVDTVKEIEARWRPAGLLQLGFGIAGVAVSVLVLRAPDVVDLHGLHPPPALMGLLMPVAMAVWLAALAGLAVSAWSVWCQVVFGGWAREEHSVLVRTSEQRTIRVGGTGGKRARILCADLAALLASETQGGKP